MERIIENRVKPFIRWGSKAPTALTLISLVFLAGCAIHPIQQDVTGLPTVVIVDRIRCETRLAVQDKSIELLQKYKDGNDEGSLRLANKLIALRGKPSPVDPNRELLAADQRRFYNRYIQTGIAFDFTFDITEENKGTLIADPVRLITNGTVGIGLNASGDYNRNNLRHFIVSDTFDNLLRDPDLTCIDKPRNYAYPISGSVGMGELISTFIDLNEDKPLTIDKANSRVFADTLTFTTTVSGQVTPHVEIAPVGNRFGLASPTNFAAFGQRVDKHMMIVGLSMDSLEGAARHALSAPAIAPLGLVRQRSALQKSGTTSAEQRALDAVTQQRLDTFLDRFGTFIQR